MKPRDKASPILGLMVGRRKFALNLLSYNCDRFTQCVKLRYSKYAFTFFLFDHLHVNTDVTKYLPLRDEDGVGAA